MGQLTAFEVASEAELEAALARAQAGRGALGEKLGTGLSSIDRLEARLLERYPTVRAALAKSERARLEAAAFHVGEVMRRAVPAAYWFVDLENDDNVYFRLPCVELPDGMPECPLTLVTASLDRRTGSYIRGVLEAIIEDNPPPRRRKRKR